MDEAMNKGWVWWESDSSNTDDPHRTGKQLSIIGTLPYGGNQQ